jgi:hypothetical protein
VLGVCVYTMFVCMLGVCGHVCMCVLSVYHVSVCVECEYVPCLYVCVGCVDVCSGECVCVCACVLR